MQVAPLYLLFLIRQFVKFDSMIKGKKSLYVEDAFIYFTFSLTNMLLYIFMSQEPCLKSCLPSMQRSPMLYIMVVLNIATCICSVTLRIEHNT